MLRVCVLCYMSQKYIKKITFVCVCVCVLRVLLCYMFQELKKNNLCECYVCYCVCFVLRVLLCVCYVLSVAHFEKHLTDAFQNAMQPHVFWWDPK